MKVIPTTTKRVRITSAADTWNHPVGMWWDSHVGEDFDVIALHDGIPRQYEVDVSRLPFVRVIDGQPQPAFIPESHVVNVDA